MYVHMGNHACKGYRCTLKPLKPLAAKNNLSLLALCRLEQITFCQCTNFHVHEDVCSVQSCTQKSCTHVVIMHWSKNISKNGPLPDCIQNIGTNQPSMTYVGHRYIYFIVFKAIPCKLVQYWFLCPSYMLRFERAPRMFLFCLWQSRFRTVGIISTKENYT